MIEKLSNNFNNLLDYSRYYLVITILVFFFVDTSEIDKTIGIIVTIIGYLMFYYFVGINIRMIKSFNKYNWEKAKKFVNFLLNFYLSCSILGILMILITSFRDITFMPFGLLSSNILIGIFLGTLKAKSKYIYE